VYVRIYRAPYHLLQHILLDVPTNFLTCVMILSETNHRKLSLRSVLLPRLSKVSFHPTKDLAGHFLRTLNKEPKRKE
jgi:hypothetical protein